MTAPEPSFSIRVNVTNPGQFFACCGLLELAHRLWPGAEGWFEEDRFCITSPAPGIGFSALGTRLREAQLAPDDSTADKKTCPLRLKLPPDADATSIAAETSLRLDWWRDQAGGGADLKTWAGPQPVTGISQAMLRTAFADNAPDAHLLDRSAAVEVEPFYFDARRYAHALDTGFSLDQIGADTMAFPAVEFLALVGLQRFRPRTTADRWTFEYLTWTQPLSAIPAAAAACGGIPLAGQRGYRFRLRFRDDQKRYKAFGFATPIGGKP